jgi:RHS repeat-associated protein
MTVLVTTSSVAQERYVYSPFGSVTLFDGTWNTIHGPFVIDNRVLFTGQQLDTVTSLYFFRLRYYCPLLGAFIARDSLTYPNGPNTYLAWFVPNNLDPSGMITVNYQYQLPGKNDPNPVPCDEAYVVEWDFVLNNTPSANGCVPYTTKNGTTIGGYIVQEVQLTCKEAPCEYINCVPKKCNLANAPAQTTTFYEAWEVPMNGTTATDQATYNPRKNKCYDLTATGTIKFICAHTSGDLRSQWGTAPLPSPCGQVNHAGIGTGSRPLWWNNSNLPEKPGSRSAHFTSQCCGGKSDFVNATYVPGA